jgi:hypothetical protein
MKVNRIVGEEELITRAIDALVKALGPIETARFLRLPRARRMDSVKRHRLLAASLSKEELYKELFEKKS